MADHIEIDRGRPTESDSTDQEVQPRESPGPEGVDAKEEVARLNDRLLRLAAEFENYKKRVARDRTEYQRLARETVLLDLLPVLDNLERALAAARQVHSLDTLIEGVELTLRMSKTVLEKAGVQEIHSVGRVFDPSVHHAVEQVSTAEYPENYVVGEALKGYTIDGRVLRPAMVQVSARFEEPVSDPGDEPASRSGRPDNGEEEREPEVGRNGTEGQEP